MLNFNKKACDELKDVALCLNDGQTEIEALDELDLESREIDVERQKVELDITKVQLQREMMELQKEWQSENAIVGNKNDLLAKLQVSAKKLEKLTNGIVKFKKINSVQLEAEFKDGNCLRYFEDSQNQFEYDDGMYTISGDINYIAKEINKNNRTAKIKIKLAGGWREYSKELADVLETVVMRNKGKSLKEIFKLIDKDDKLSTMRYEECMVDKDLKDFLEQAIKIYNR